LGGFLSDNDLRLRDQTVFDNILAPIAYCHAGGYQPANTIFNDPVLAIHRATLNAADLSVASRLQKGLAP
jgi:hypothetical protein